eukprot:TRINITY_DN65274_c0_g1_i1.p1 TRINITY_DN65274_c0_g1~~TRINITY_DN65274_c0_g1_i1.p1  ORF type:complete len:687 (+),score=124.62 TRINITY_DN65274_c0_g1_i1:71-2131(+)
MDRRLSTLPPSLSCNGAGTDKVPTPYDSSEDHVSSSPDASSWRVPFVEKALEHLNDPAVGDDMSMADRQQRVAHPPDMSREGCSTTRELPYIGSKPIAIPDDLNPHATIAGLLCTLNAHFADVLEGQQEIRKDLNLLRRKLLPKDNKVDTLGGSGGAQAKRPVRGNQKVNGMNGNTSAVEDPTQAGFTDAMPPAASSMQPEDGLPLEIKLQDVEKFQGRLSDVKCQGRSSFNALRTEDEDLMELCTVLLTAEAAEQSATQTTTYRQQLQEMTGHELELLIDSFIGIVVVSNCIFIAYSYDAPPSQMDALFVADLIFSILFILELLLKVSLHGLRGQFCGEASKLNIFDAFLIAVDTIQLILTQLLSRLQGTNFELPSVSLFRVLRLVRLMRLLRLLRYHVFDDMITMVGGMVGGMTTLFWAMILYCFAVMFIALLFRETLGTRKVDNVYEYFQDVPTAMFTVFRCSFGECDALEGKPIFEHVARSYGPGYSLMYFFFMFFTVLGLFNVISAMFIEATMASTAAMRHHQKKARLQDSQLWATRMYTMFIKLVKSENIEVPPGGSLVDIAKDIYTLDISATKLQTIASDFEVKQALNDLEIDPEDHDQLSEILDPDQNGSITVVELIDGLKKLRGEPKRSDIVQLDLMLRSVMGVVKEIKAAVGPPAVSPAASTQLAPAQQSLQGVLH